VLVVFVDSSLLKVPNGGNSSVSSAQLFAIYSRRFLANNSSSDFFSFARERIHAFFFAQFGLSWKREELLSF
jgi:hypothetical protein